MNAADLKCKTRTQRRWRPVRTIVLSGYHEARSCGDDSGTSSEKHSAASAAFRAPSRSAWSAVALAKRKVLESNAIGAEKAPLAAAAMSRSAWSAVASAGACSRRAASGRCCGRRHHLPASRPPRRARCCGTRAGGGRSPATPDVTTTSRKILDVPTNSVFHCVVLYNSCWQASSCTSAEFCSVAVS